MCGALACPLSQEFSMDLVYILLVLALTAASLGLIQLCERVQ
jgi:hypothetical protein